MNRVRLPIVLIILTRHLRINASWRQPIEEIAPESDIDIPVLEPELHDPCQHALHDFEIFHRQRNSCFNTERVPPKIARTVSDLNRPIDDAHCGFGLLFEIKLLLGPFYQWYGIVGFLSA